MPVLKKRVNFTESAEGIWARQTLERLVADSAYNTDSTYSTDAELYPGNLIPFVEKHMNNLNSHPDLDATQYIANIRLMTRIR
ncbi:MAG TPA: hypothetical protein PKA02_00505 [Candidatus Saccharibacteria bacterium]|jgi:hypothetical protein|nr:hypothetical protein [Candidatus Saccharibacteria bacterium]